MSRVSRHCVLLLGCLIAAALTPTGCYYQVEDLADVAASAPVCEPACDVDQLCVEGSCKKNCAGFTECSGQCKDTSVDPSHCGGCDKVCGSGQVCDGAQCKGTCSDGKTACGASCVDLQVDKANCGSCGNGCAAGEDCVGAACVVSCEQSLAAGVKDPWGNTWDSTDRSKATLDQAIQTCDAMRARLPLATEVYRLRAGQPGALPATSGDLLWTGVPVDVATQLSIRANNGTTTALARAEPHAYRCMCPGPVPPGFGSGDCLGSLGNECFALQLGDSSYHLDRADRPLMPKTSAMFECGFGAGRLATAAELVGAIGLGLPNGSDVHVFISDEESAAKSAVLRWLEGSTDWNPQSGSIHARPQLDFLPGRCIGPSIDPGPHPNPVPAQFVSRTGRKMDGDDSAPLSYDQAIDACWLRGGHLPSATELVELIMEGMPGGSGLMLHTADHASAGDAVGVRWSGVAVRFEYGSDVDSSPKTSKRPYRCIYYPIDPNYAGPPGAQCAECTRFDLSGGAAVWVDKADRGPAVGGTAARDCAKQGGRLTSVRDLLEVIPRGLPVTGTGFMDTLEIVSDVTAGNWLLQPQATLVKTAPNDPASYEFTQKGATRAYRCLWTNEVR